MNPVSIKHVTRCDGCSQMTPSYDIVNYGSVELGCRHLCSQCFNAEVAKTSGLEGFEHAQFEPVGITDCAGDLHQFHFRTRLFGTGIALDAFELREGDPDGYYFQIIGDPKADLFLLFGQLVEKIRRGLSVRHLKNSECGLQVADQQLVRGRIEWDPAHDGHLPLLVIDGRKIEWHEFGRMLMSFEGFQFKLTLADKSYEL